MQYDFALGAYQSQQLDVRGRFFKLVIAAGTVRVTTNTGERIDLLPGQGVWGADFQWLSLQDRTGADNAGTILAGAFDFHDDRITGTVDVVDGGRTRTNNSQAFMSWGDVGADVSGQTVHQLWNPAGSGKNVVVEQIQYSSNSALFVSVGLNTGMLTTKAANGTCKKAGSSTISTAERRFDYKTAEQIVGTPVLYSVLLQAGVNVDRKFNEPVLLVPGTGLVIFGGTANVELAAGFEWFEEPI